MSQTIDVNGQSINYPETGDTNWGDEATDFAVQTSAALGKLGLASGTSVDIAQTLDVTGNTTLDANLSVAGTTSLTGNVTLTNNLTVNGNTALGNASTDTTTVTGIVNVDSGVLYVDPVNNRVGINDTTPSEALDVTGNVAISGNSAITGNETVGGTLGVTGNTSLSGTLGVTGDVAINTNKFNVTASSGNTIIAGTLGVTGNTNLSGNLSVSGSFRFANGSASTPSISFASDPDTGIYSSGTNEISISTNAVERFKISSTGQLSAVVPTGSTLYLGYLCRAWVNFDGSLSTPITPRANGNVSSITKNATGNYTINFLNNMPDVNYVAIGNAMVIEAIGNNTDVTRFYTRNNNNISLVTVFTNGTGPRDCTSVMVGIFR